MTQMSMLRTELVVGGVMIRLTTRRRRQCSNWSLGYGIHESSDFIGKTVLLTIVMIVQVCRFTPGGHWFVRVLHQGDRMLGACS